MAMFTTIATAAGLAMSAGTTAASFAQANKQKKLQVNNSISNKFTERHLDNLDLYSNFFLKSNSSIQTVVT